MAKNENAGAIFFTYISLTIMAFVMGIAVGIFINTY